MTVELSPETSDKIVLCKPSEHTEIVINSPDIIKDIANAIDSLLIIGVGGNINSYRYMSFVYENGQTVKYSFGPHYIKRNNKMYNNLFGSLDGCIDFIDKAKLTIEY